VDEDEEGYEVEDEDDTEEEWSGMETYRELPSGLNTPSTVWNLLTFVSECAEAFDKLIRNFRADLEITSAKKREESEFMSSVEAGIESLG
jgi:hypothetical protein